MPLALARMPAVPPSHEIVTDLVMDRAPKLPASRQLISPNASVWLSAWKNVAHGKARVQGLASLPLPETQVRDAAAAGAVTETIETKAAATRTAAVSCFIACSSWKRSRRRCPAS